MRPKTHKPPLKLDDLATRGTPERALLDQIDLNRLPQHVAVIMDGNGRWAKQRNLPRVKGHRAGIDAVAEMVEMAARLGINILTLYAFSAENWKRPKSEVDTLMRILKHYLSRELDNLVRNNIRLRTIGRISELEPSICRGLEQATAKTARNTGMLLNVALNYSGRAEIVDAVRTIFERHNKNGGGKLTIDEKTFQAHLYTGNLPDPDLLIRTSGEMRISNFLLWQIAYAEIWVTPTLWPDFRRGHLFQALVDYQRRERRYGGV